MYDGMDVGEGFPAAQAPVSYSHGSLAQGQAGAPGQDYQALGTSVQDHPTRQVQSEKSPAQMRAWTPSSRGR